MQFRITSIALLAAGVSFGMLACKGGEKSDSTSVTPSGTPEAAKPAPNGKVIMIEAITDEKGSFFKPKEVEAHVGDVLRFTLVQGVHNMNFLPDSNPGVSNLPPLSAYLQLPGQTIDIVVPDAKGKRLYYHCDPHALLGMIGYVKVED